MKPFRVTKREVWTQDVIVEAKDSDDAIRRVRSGEGEEVDNTLEYSHTMGEETWTVEKEAK